jgi:tripartite-type tricarboxylate transporter receptor subunit TctC
VGKAVRSPEFTTFIETSGFWLDYKNAAEFGKFLAQQHLSNGKLLKAGGFIR